ncbi:hypothetical protein QP922_04055 [Corynebacterium sp. MSK218]|uniref:hypothetical protein n=1 Tax=Corynebacterium sp. MSK218 TaxID=3050218 RepID=UPI002550B0CE|nr:hypothetical protein [Corynebacterium sp. MSK218]MDK8762999.1 hypothetical protein [Corynebacterium sp. MSK218]
MPQFASHRRRFAAAIAAGCLTVLPVAASNWGDGVVAHAQDATIPVPAGQTTTVSLPVPVDVNMAADGWTVSASGGSATVTAPAVGGQLSVPVTYQGVTMTFLLVADEHVTGQDLNDAAANGDPESLGGPAEGAGPEGDPALGAHRDGDSGASSDTGEREGREAGEGDGGAAPGAHRDEESGADSGSGEREGREAGHGQAQTPHTGRGWEGLDDSHTEYVNLESTIEGQTITAKLGFKQALDLYNRFKHLEDDGVTLRYLNAQGEFVEGVQRDIDKASRTMTLTYPEGATPDNPFIMQFIQKESQTAELVVTLTDPTTAVAEGVPGDQQLGADGQDNAEENGADGEGNSAGRHIAAFGGVGLVVLIAGLVFWRSRGRKSSH